MYSVYSSFGHVINHLVSYPVPAGLSYAWGIGSISGIMLAVQIVSGLMLTSGFVIEADLAFGYVEGFIMREVWDGWLWRMVHANGASIFFLAVYMHMLRGLYYGLYASNRTVWLVGVLIYGIMMGTAFIGYVLPWGQMSFWGATVITNMLSVLPNGIGNIVVRWVWGEYGVGAVTLRRFYTLHFLLPFVLVALVLGHIGLLHASGSSVRLGIEGRIESLRFFPYCYVKDMFGVVATMLLLVLLVGWFPWVLGHVENATVANALVTPRHIVPEWYFLPFYAMLRSVPHKAVGVVLMLAGVVVLAGLGWYRMEVYSSTMNRSLRVGTLFMTGAFIILGILGGRGTDIWSVRLSWVSMGIYFGWVLVGIPITLYADSVSAKA